MPELTSRGVAFGILLLVFFSYFFLDKKVGKKSRL